MAHHSRDGLEWDDEGFDLKPRWARQPQLDRIAQLCRRALDVSAEDRCIVTFHAEGAFNKLYRVESPRGTSLLCESLPVDPKHKTRGQVTTLRWIRHMTRVPVPKVIAFDDNQDNEVGFEWILMELMPGVSAYKRWRKMSMAAKTRLAEQVAEFQSQLFRHSIIRQEQAEVLVKEDPDEDDREEAEDCLRVATKLTKLLPKIFPSLQNPAEQTVLWHDDLSLANILVDDDGKVTALIDWECVSCKPLWVAAEMPEFLLGPRREEEPNRDGYGDASDDIKGPDDLDDEG